MENPDKSWIKNLGPQLQEARNAFQHVLPALRLVWAADRWGSLAMGALTLVNALVPVAQAWVGKLIVDSVVQFLGNRPAVSQADILAGLRSILPYLSLEFGLLFLSTVCLQLRGVYEQILDHKLGHLINSRIIRKALALELKYFEDADFYDRMQNARKQSEYRALAILNGGTYLIQGLITLISFTAILIAFNPWVAAILFGATLPAFVAQTRYSKLNFRLQTWRAPETRQMTYFEHLLTVDSSAKEIKLFGLGEPLLKRYSDLFWKTFNEDSSLAWKRTIAGLGWGLIAMISYYGSYAWIIFRALSGAITLGGMTLYISIFRQSQTTFKGIFDSVNSLYENGLFMENLFSFLNQPEPSEGDPQPLSQESAAGEIEFKNVSFRYPDREDWALRNVTFRALAGEKIALVGENGSGKTTLIKLLTRLYDPTEGQILYNGRDLREYPLNELRKKIGVIFQDFVRYQLTLRENIGFGSIEDLGDLPRIERAAEKGGADEVVRSIPEKWDATLGGWFVKGRELSGGQWQKIALSRAFMREGEVLVLDEPTSALDAEREYEIFRRFKELTRGRTAFLISHRFSTVRMADRILVLAGGKVEESGTHDQLVVLKGNYARLFELQAQGYR